MPTLAGMDEEAARRAFLEVALDAAHDAVLWVDLDGRIRWANRSACRIFGYADGLAGLPLERLLPPHLRERVGAALAAVAGGGRLDGVEIEALRADGMPVPVTVAIAPVPGAGGRPVSAAVVVRDDTEQRLAQARLAEVEAQIREGEALSGLGSWLFDVRTGVVQWNEQLHRICGVDPLVFEGTLEAHLGAVHPDDRARLRQSVADAVRSGQGFVTEYRVVRPDGEERRLRASVTATVGSGGEVVGIRGVVADVTGAP